MVQYFIQLIAAAEQQLVLMIGAWLEFLNTALLCTLDGIHGKVGIFTERIKVLRILWIPGNPRRQANPDFFFPCKGDFVCVDLSMHTLNNRTNFTFLLIVMEEDKEFIPCHARYDTAGGGELLQIAGGGTDELITGVVSIGVIDYLQVVKIP